MKNRNSTFTTILLALGFLALSPIAQAVSPPPDGGYPGGNTAEGTSALLGRTTGLYNTAVGIFSLLSLTDGNFCTGVGAGTLLANTGDSNTATGAGALFSNTTCFYTTAYVVGALRDKDIGAGNAGIGYFALLNDVTASGYITIGVGAGTNITGGNNNIDIGKVGLDGGSNTSRIGVAKVT